VKAFVRFDNEAIVSLDDIVYVRARNAYDVVRPGHRTVLATSSGTVYLSHDFTDVCDRLQQAAAVTSRVWSDES